MAPWGLWILTASFALPTGLCSPGLHPRWSHHNGDRINRVFQFASNGTQIENLAVRSNGNILFTLTAPAAEVWEVNPKLGNDSARMIASNAALGGHATALGITEVQQDVFAVIDGNATVADTFNIHTIDFTYGDDPRINLVASVPEARTLNGLTTLNPHEGTLLASDSFQGKVYRINIKTGEHKPVMQDQSMLPLPPALPFGINGVRRVGSVLYYVNSSKHTYYRVKINDNGTAAGPYELLADLGDVQGLPDDFTITPNGMAFIAGSNEVVVSRVNGAHFVLAGSENGSLLAGATSTHFGRRRNDRRTLYVSCNGGSVMPVNGTFVEPGFIDAIELR